MNWNVDSTMLVGQQGYNKKYSTIHTKWSHIKDEKCEWLSLIKINHYTFL